MTDDVAAAVTQAILTGDALYYNGFVWSYCTRERTITHRDLIIPKPYWVGDDGRECVTVAYNDTLNNWFVIPDRFKAPEGRLIDVKTYWRVKL